MAPTLPRRTLACLLLLLIPVAAGAADGVELRWKFQKGDVHKYLMKHKEVRTVKVGDQTFETTTTMEYEWQWTVKDVDDKGTASLEQKLTGLRASSTGLNFDFQYDSTRANQSDEDYKKKLIHLYDQLRFATFKLKVKRDGRVSDLEGFSKVLGEVTPGTQVGDFHGLNLYDDTFTWYLQQLLGTLPETAVTTGGKWKTPVQTKLSGFGDLTGQMEFTLQDKPVKVADRPCQEVRLGGSQALELDMKWLNNPLKGTLKTTKLAGAVRFDPKAGSVRSSEVQAEMSGELKLGPGDNPAVLKVTFQHTLELEAK